MNIMAEFNAAFGRALPAWSWDVLEIIVGALVVVGVILQRRYSERFQSSKIVCAGDWITVRCGQLGLTGIGTLAFLVMLDGAMPGQAPPRTFTILFLTSYLFVQTRVLFDVVRLMKRRPND